MRTITSLAKQYKQSDIRVRRRLGKGWTLEEALLTPGWQAYRYKDNDTGIPPVLDK